jgi:hypothetical protein
MIPNSKNKFFILRFINEIVNFNIVKCQLLVGVPVQCTDNNL